MENSQILKPTDTSKYNLRCNRNISEKMTKKDFIYDIPAPFQAVRIKDKCLPSGGVLKKSRGDFECLITSSAVGSSQLKGSARSEGKLNKNPVGLLRLIQPQKLTPSITAVCKSSNPKSQQEERIVKEPERCDTESEIRRQIVLPIQLRRKIGSDSKPSRYSVIPTKGENQLTISNGDQVPERKILGYQCNYCHERVATLLSLSTHVKYHNCQRHCNTCFWILEPQESMTQHLQKAHPVNRPDHVPTPNHM